MDYTCCRYHTEKDSNGKPLGEDSNGKPHGKGMMQYIKIDKSGECWIDEYTGNFVGGKREGIGFILYDDGSFYSGCFVNDKRHGFGKMVDPNRITIYEGEWRNDNVYCNTYTGETNKFGTPHGNGTMQYAKFKNRQIIPTDKYSGTFINGNRTGLGSMTYFNGDQYEGEWLDNRPHGEGMMIYHNGNVYIGSFKSGDPFGMGIMTYSDGRLYSGEFDVLPSGQGSMRYPDRSSYKGMFDEDSRLSGYGVMTYFDGNQYHGMWDRNKKHGKGTMYYPDGTFDEGEWIRDKKISNEEITSSDSKAI
jgi:hypothetical protein